MNKIDRSWLNSAMNTAPGVHSGNNLLVHASAGVLKQLQHVHLVVNWRRRSLIFQCSWKPPLLKQPDTLLACIPWPMTTLFVLFLSSASLSRLTPTPELLPEPTSRTHQRAAGADKQWAEAGRCHSCVPVELPDDDDFPAAAVLHRLPSGLLHPHRTGGSGMKLDLMTFWILW